ncbi:MAG: diguanylate phosphodiesterase [Bacillales bacterium]|nr:diguanylate phosphodiesterase [Bacillales bacterium]
MNSKSQKKYQLHFQPIISADEIEVIGFEIYATNSLEQVDREYIDISNLNEINYLNLMNQILIETKLISRNKLIFIKIDANILVNELGDKLLELILGHQEQGYNISNIVLELPEHEFEGDIESLYYLTKYYRTYGIKIALLGICQEKSNLDRVKYISPNIMKIDLGKFKVQYSSNFSLGFLKSLSMLSSKIGATLLYDNIESDLQLYYAWTNNGRYYQGNFISGIQSQISILATFNHIKDEFQDFVIREMKKLDTLFNLQKKLNGLIKFELSKIDIDVGYNTLLENLARTFTDMGIRLFIVDDLGYQKSYNYYKVEGNWVAQSEFEGRNWGWRPYFLRNILQMKYESNGTLSDVYTDVETHQMLRTFSYPISKNHFLFIDLDPSFLYEEDVLL